MNLDMADANRLMAELRETAAELQHELRALGDASKELTAVTVEDEKKAVKLTLAASGAVETLALDEDWRDKIGEDVLGLTVTSCYQRAIEQRAGQWMTAYSENAEKDTAEPDAAVPEPEPVELGDPSSEWGTEGRERLRAMYDAAEAEQQDFLAHHARRAREERDGVNSAKTVTVTREGETITAVKLDERWVRNSNDSTIEREIVSALNGVMAMAAHDRENKYEGFPAIQQLAEIGHNPRELMRRMGAIR